MNHFGEFEQYMISSNSSVYTKANFEAGMRLLKAYHNAASVYSGYGITFEQFLDQFVRTARPKSYDIIIAGIGEIHTIYGRSESWARGVVEQMARVAQGKVPENWMSFQAAMNQAHLNNPQYWEAAKFVTIETAKKAIQTVQAVGDGIVTTLNMSKYIIPVAAVGLLGLVGFIIYKKSDKLADKVISRI